MSQCLGAYAACAYLTCLGGYVACQVSTCRMVAKGHPTLETRNEGEGMHETAVVDDKLRVIGVQVSLPLPLPVVGWSADCSHDCFAWHVCLVRMLPSLLSCVLSRLYLVVCVARGVSDARLG